ncbi:hypothetical protein [Vulcanisaeta souniana]|uniref:Uncharacterized protein n=1 Tax=Vulcanisaeta souniana JCM 11219 TaxID=1293586 RepID=A0A830E067_9CREN|nr:hypothetical protein [Vulcanisaeta souniana]BDR91531.1 hypothetical protein Vsou_06240 [Vulcanisaeta souniana JCM 11219]GGI73914.1 hypothetical protein GCM10007112_08430 [Vulcanisaeta souniana JCM 11219]
MSHSRPLSKVLALVFGVILMAIGVAVILGMLFLIPMYMIVKPVAILGGSSSFTITNNSVVLTITVSAPTRITLTAINAYFKIAIVPVSSLLPFNDTYQSSFFTHWVNLSMVHGVNFTGNYTSITTELRPGYVLLVWPYQVNSTYALLSCDYRQSLTYSQQTAGNPAVLLLLIPPLLICTALLFGGIVLIRWSRK